MKVSILVLSALLGCTAAHAQQAEPPRTIGVSGQGEVRAEPDRATVTLGVESRKPKLEDARAAVAKTVDAVLKLTRELKIDPKLVRSTRINVQPEYNWGAGNANERTLIGYYVARQVEVELHDLEKLGQLLERATDVGVNQVGEPRLDSSKRPDLVREALAKAVADARQNAEVVAKAAGAKLGNARTINANTELTQPTPMVRAMAMEAKAAGGAPYQSGEMTFNATVSVQYDLIPQ
jgi:uncharacterized protein